MKTKKAAVVFHSVCGNTYQLAKVYYEALNSLGVKTDLFKVRDLSYEETAPLFESSQEFKNEIDIISTVSNSKELLEYDYMFFGSPTYFGNVSGQMKCFMDTFGDVWGDALLFGKYFGAFAVSSTAQGGCDSCLKSLNTFAEHMGMIVLPVPSNVKSGPHPAYGIAHYSGADSLYRITEQTKEGIYDYIERILKFS